jgi:hypothetical protein
LTTALVPTEPLTAALALATEAGDIAALKDIRAMGTALTTGARARGMGIEQENKAAEVVLRAERGIGQALTALRDEGRFLQGGFKKAPNLDAVVAASRAGAATVKELAAASGVPENKIATLLSTSAAFERAGDNRWRLVESEIERREAVTTLSEIGVSNTDSSNFQRLATLSDEEFEALLDQARESGRRIAKTNFYAATSQPKPRGEYERPETPLDTDFENFRRGAFGILGWEIDANGAEGPTKNGLLSFPEDGLRQTALIIKALAAAYNEARSARN